MSGWTQLCHGLSVEGLGAQDLLTLPMSAFFASRQCPGSAIRAAMDWALQQAQVKRVVISGFHSPLEQSVLTVLIQARSPVVVVLSRPVGGARLPVEWTEPLAQGHLAVVSTVTTITRLTGELAVARNQLVAQLAADIVVAHANPGGGRWPVCWPSGRWISKGLSRYWSELWQLPALGISLSLGQDNEVRKSKKLF